MPLITKAAADAGRPPPRIIAAVVACITDDADAARRRIAATSKPYATMPAFTAMLEREGVASQVDLGLIGDEATARAKAQRFIDAGATELAVREAPGTPEEAARTRRSSEACSTTSSRNDAERRQQLVEPGELALGGPASLVEQGLHGDAVGDRDQALGARLGVAAVGEPATLGERRRRGRGTRGRRRAGRRPARESPAACEQNAIVTIQCRRRDSSIGSAPSSEARSCAAGSASASVGRCERRLASEVWNVVEQQLTLVGEVVGERAGGPARLGRDLAHRGRLDARAGDQARRGLGELGPSLFDVDDLRHVSARPAVDSVMSQVLCITIVVSTR